MQATIDTLIAHGWEPAGETRLEHVRIPTIKNPVFGGLGGERRTLGGRLRFKRGDWFVTVGKRTTCFYIFGTDRQIVDARSIRTKDVSEVTSFSASLPIAALRLLSKPELHY